MSRIITVSGGKGGVGKTNISLNLALCLSRQGRRVCLFDADLGLANVNVLLGLYPEYDLEDVILSRKTLSEVIISDYQGIDIIPGSSGTEKIANLDDQNIGQIVEEFSRLDTYDYIIVDSSAGISRSVVSFCLAATDVLMVITPEPTSLTDAYALMKVLHFNRFTGSVKVAVNQCENTAAARRTFGKLKDVVQKYLSVTLEPIGMVVQDKKLIDAVNNQKPLVVLYPEAPATKCLQVIAARILENESAADFAVPSFGTFWTRFRQIASGPLRFSEKGQEDEPLPVSRTQDTGSDASGPVRQEQPAPEQAEAQKGAEVSPAVQSRSAPPAKPKQHGAPVLMTRGLPTLPHILFTLMETCSRDDVSMDEVAAVVEKDPGLSTRILRMVNSVYYYFSQEVYTVHQALTLLGLDTVRNIAVSASVYQVFDGIEAEDGFNLKSFWWHSLMTAVVANMLAQKCAYPSPEEAFLSGLLHDIGKLVLLSAYPDRYPALVQSVRDIHDAEKQQLGETHSEMGARLVHHWHLQPFIADAILYHHEKPERIEHALLLVKIIYIANRLCAGDAEREHLYSVAQQQLGIDRADVDALVAQAEAQVTQIAASLDIDVEQPRQEDASFSEKEQSIRRNLTNRVRDISLLHGTLQQFLYAHDQKAIIQTAHQGMEILFDIRQMVLFVYEESRNVLLCPGSHCFQPHVTRDLLIPFEEGKGLIVSALLENRVLESFSVPQGCSKTIIDEQVVRLLGTEGFVCIPLRVGHEHIGTAVIGLDSGNRQALMEQTALLKMLFNNAALALMAEKTRQAFAQKALSERLAASTAIAGKVAHEVNNPLSIIKNYLKILELKLADQNMPAEEISVIRDEIDRVAAIVESLSDLSRPKRPPLEDTDINGVISDMCTLFRQDLEDRDIRLQFAPDEACPPCRTNKDCIKQICMNLIKNAAEAIGKNGNIYVETAYESPVDTITLAVKDDGPGLPDVIRERVFDPYASTKGSGHAGLGLSVVYNTVKQLQGTITCDTEKNKGTTFLIRLPREAGTAE